MRQAAFYFDQLVKQDVSMAAAFSGTKNTLDFMLYWKVHLYPAGMIQCSNCFTPHTHTHTHTHTCFRHSWSLSMIAIEFYNINHAQWAAVITDYYGNARIGNTIKKNYDFDLPIKSNDLELSKSPVKSTLSICNLQSPKSQHIYVNNLWCMKDIRAESRKTVKTQHCTASCGKYDSNPTLQSCLESLFYAYKT